MNKSLGKRRTACGYEIRQMPLGAYLRALESIKDLPEDFMRAVFGDITPREALELLTNFDEAAILTTIRAALTTAPRYVLRFLAEISGVSEDILETDEEIGLDGLMEIIMAVIEVNDLKNFFRRVKQIASALGLNKASLS